MPNRAGRAHALQRKRSSAHQRGDLGAGAGGTSRRAGASVSSSAPPIRVASSEPIASPSPKPPSSLRVAAALEALEDQLALVSGHARALVGDLDRRRAVPLRDADLDRRLRRRDAQRVVEQDAHDPRDAAGVGLRP